LVPLGEAFGGYLNLTRTQQKFAMGLLPMILAKLAFFDAVLPVENLHPKREIARQHAIIGENCQPFRRCGRYPHHSPSSQALMVLATPWRTSARDEIPT